MFKNFSFAAIVAAALFAVLPAQATVLTFDSPPISSFTSLAEQGYTVTAPSYAYVANYNLCTPTCPYDGSNYLMTIGSTISLAATAGTAFSLTSFDGAETFANYPSLWATSIVVTGTLMNGSTVSQSFLLDAIDDGIGSLVDFQTFSLAGFTNLRSVTFSGSNINEFSLDNINVAGSAVPEPGSVALLGLGLIGFSLARRKQK